jgi:hypothetical protein
VIVGSLLLILGAVALLALGLVRGSDAYLVASIVASLLAAIALVVGSRRAGDARERSAEQPARARGRERSARVAAQRTEESAPAAAERSAYLGNRDEPMSTQLIPAIRDDGPAEAGESGQRTMVAVQEPAAIPAQGGGPGGGFDRGSGGFDALDDDDDDDDDDGFDDEDPPDEPVAQQVSAGDQARVARMTNEVLVIDGRPRYHLPGCVHLLGRDSEPLPVHEAVELGFTPCGLCEPDSAMIAASRRV